MIALLLRDLRLAVRAGGGFGLGLAFFLIVVVLVPFGVGPDQDVLSRVAPGILWVASLLAALLSLDRIFALDFEDGSLTLLATSPLPLEGVAWMKALAHWLTTGLPLTVAAPALGLLLNLAPQAYGFLFLSMLIGTPALSMIGTFGAALTVGLRRGGLLLSLLVLLRTGVVAAAAVGVRRHVLDGKNCCWFIRSDSIQGFLFRHSNTIYFSMYIPWQYCRIYGLRLPVLHLR